MNSEGLSQAPPGSRTRPERLGPGWFLLPILRGGESDGSSKKAD